MERIKSAIKGINRFKALLVVWAMVLAWCAFISTNVYMNAFVIYISIMLILCALAYVDENSTDKEERWKERVGNIF